MDLILKITELCNFKCTFCSSTDIAPGDDRARVLDIDYVFDFLTRFPNTKTIIVNGGDPLMVKPDYYWQIINWLDDHNYDDTTISFTTNLWAFYKKPEMWQDLFNHPRMGIVTSFNYGPSRRITTSRVYTEDDFWNVSDLFLERCGYRPDFISVVTDETYDTAVDNVQLAKRMGVECKLNDALASGAQSAPYMLGKMYQIYLDVYNAGLMEWEYNTKQIISKLNNGASTCPLARTCDSGIRCLSPKASRNGSTEGYNSCGAFDDDNSHGISFKEEVVNKGAIQTPLSVDPNLHAMHAGCYGCPNFDLCNGCRKKISDHKEHGLVEEHCAIMKAQIPEWDVIKREHFV